MPLSGLFGVRYDMIPVTNSIASTITIIVTPRSSRFDRMLLVSVIAPYSSMPTSLVS